ncbi:hypothetical protein RJ641_026245 [Dillenia turbinata]|uniref:CCR4-NOT transcription complex subunit 10 n=1 Tax=Dillenia turbinata TaxID=194707 RepID=A0AAN8W2G0_9MAGN
MDSRDSANANNREGSTDDDGLVSLTAGLAKDAALLFQSGKFGECVDALNQLLQKKEDDPKVLHNVAIAEYFRDGCSDPRKLLEVLNNVKKRSEEVARASGEHLEASANTGNKITSGSKGTNISQNFSSQYTDEFDTSVTMLNMAIIWFHLHDYVKALSVLEPLYENIEPIDENTALDICLLLLDVALALHDASKSADVINYLEKAFGLGNMINQGDNGNTSNQQSSNPVAKPPSVRATADASNSDSTGSANVSENALSRTLSEETDYETLFSTLDIGGQNLSRTAGPPPNDILGTPADRSISISDLKFKLHLYKVRLLLLTRNLKAAKREVKMAMMNGARGRDSSMALLLKSQLEYARGNHRKAIKLLMASGNRTETGMTSIFFNNLGCIHYQLGKYHTSSVYFSRALNISSSLQKDKPLKLASFSQDKSLQIIYNSGVQYLACGKPILAANCFKKASLIFYNQPLLWLRIAECCLMAKEKGLLKSYGALPDASEIEVKVAGKGKWRHLVIDGVSRSLNVNSLEKDDWFSDNGRQLNLSLPLARRCLLDALHLLNSSVLKIDSPNPSTGENESVEGAAFKNSNHKTLSGSDSKAKVIIGSSQVNANGDAKEPKAGASSISTLQSSISDYEDICRRENQMIMQAVLADLAYVELELGNPLKALVAANSLLRLPGCSRIYIFIARVYAAEALCLLNRPKEAAEHLSTYLSLGNNVELPYTEDDREQWQAVKVIESDEMNGGSAAAKTTTSDESQGLVFLMPEEARGILYTNFAVTSAVQGDLQQALTFAMQALSILPNSSEAILTTVYVDLMLGKSQDALVKLKNCTRVRFVPSSLLLNGSSSSL